jgi:hypothetical protein
VTACFTKKYRRFSKTKDSRSRNQLYARIAASNAAWHSGTKETFISVNAMEVAKK